MATFQRVKLGDIFKLEYGKGLIAEKRVAGDFSVYGSSGQVGTHNEYLVEGPGIIIGRKGSVGEIYFSKKNFYPIDTSYYIRKNDKKYNLRFVYYFLKSQNLRRLQGDVGVPGLNRETVHNEIVSFIDDKFTQNQIASVLSTYDDLIENNEKRIKTLEELAQRLYTEWFVKFKFPGHEKTPMVDSGTAYGMIPEGWEVKRLDDIANQNRKSVSPTSINSKTPYVGLEHIPRKTIILSQWGQANEVKSSKLIFKMGDILFGKIRPYFHKVVIAPINGVSSSDIIVISPKEEKYKSFVLFLTSSEAFVFHATKTSQGTKMPRAEWRVLKGYNIALPTDNNLILKFNSTINSMINEMNILMFINRKLQFTRDLLIPQLVTGKRILK